MADGTELEPAEALAARSPIRTLNELADYRAARQDLLAREYELRRMTERVAEQRRALPPGPVVETDYRFASETGEVTLSGMFGARDTLWTYSYMFGPERTAPCPMCTGFMNALALRVPALQQNLSVAFIARAPLERLVEAKRKLGMPDLPVFSDITGDYSRDWVDPEDGDVPALNVFVRRDGTTRLFYRGEMSQSDPGQDPRGAPEVDPIWTVLDQTPAGRRPDWYPSLNWAGRD